MAREPYGDQVQLLIDVLPVIAGEPDFALKGGTAINLFFRDLPRLSIDIDLTFLPVKHRDQSLREINEAMDRIAAEGARLAGVKSSRIPGGGGGATRIRFERGGVSVKVETSPVTRGVVFAPSMRRVAEQVEDRFGFAETLVASFEDVFAGKIHAALDRQHPRDLFDIKLLYEEEGLTDALFRAFMVYLASSSRPPHEILAPKFSPLNEVYDREFAGMALREIRIEDLEAARKRLVDDVQSRLRDEYAQFLRGLIMAEPDFSLIGVSAAADLPAVRWKLQNLARLMDANPEKHRLQAEALNALLR